MKTIFYMDRYIRLRIILLMVLLFFNCSAHSSELFSFDGLDVYLKPDEIIKGIPDDTHLTVLDLTIGKYTLDDVKAKLGKAEILYRNEHEPKKVCYFTKQNSLLNVIIFEAGPLGSWKTVTGFSLFSDNNSFKERDFCTEISSLSKPIQTKSGIKIGMTFDNLISILGKPSKILNDEVVYVYQSKRNMSKSELHRVASSWPEAKNNPYFDVFSSILVKFHKSKLTYYKATKIESY